MADDVIKFDCPHCGRAYAVPASAAGKSSACKGCGRAVTVPARSDAKYAAPGGAAATAGALGGTFPAGASGTPKAAVAVVVGVIVVALGVVGIVAYNAFRPEPVEPPQEAGPVTPPGRLPADADPTPLFMSDFAAAELEPGQYVELAGFAVADDLLEDAETGQSEAAGGWLAVTSEDNGAAGVPLVVQMDTPRGRADEPPLAGQETVLLRLIEQGGEHEAVRALADARGRIDAERVWTARLIETPIGYVSRFARDERGRLVYSDQRREPTPTAVAPVADGGARATVNLESLAQERAGDALGPDGAPAQPSATEVSKLKPFRAEAAAVATLGAKVGVEGYTMRIPAGMAVREDRADQSVHFEGRFEQTGFIKAALRVKERPQSQMHLPWPPANNESGFLEGARVERGLINGEPWLRLLKRHRTGGGGQQWAFLYATFAGDRYVELRGSVDGSDRAWDALEAAATTIDREPVEAP